MISTWILTCTLLAQTPAPAVDQSSQPPAAPITSQTAQKPAAPASQPAAAPTQVSPWTDDQPFTHLFQNLGKDLRALGSVETAEILFVGGGAAALVHPKDDNVAAWVQRQPPASYTDVGNAIGSGFTQSGIAIALWAAGTAAGHDEMAHIGSDLIRAQVLNEVLVGTMKVAINRTRPNGSSQSFPSGHTSATVATAAVLQSHFGWRAGAAGYAVASFVAWSRIRSNNHYMSDVMFGAAVGAVSGRAATRGHKSTWSVAPVKTPGGFAVIVSRRR